MNKFLKLIVVLAIAFLMRDVSPMYQEGTDKIFDLEVMQLKQEIASLESELEAIKLEKRGIKQQLNGKKKIELSVVEALNHVVNRKDVSRAAVDFAKRYTITDVNTINKFEFNRRENQTILHWIFRGGIHSLDSRIRCFENPVVLNETIDMNDAKYRALQALLLWGADINRCNSKGKTALHYAANSFNCDAVKLLCQAGANVNITNNKGTIPLLSLLRRHQEIEGSVERCIAALVESGSDLKKENGKGDSVEKFIKEMNEQDNLPDEPYSTLVPLIGNDSSQVFEKSKLEFTIEKSLPKIQYNYDLKKRAMVDYFYQQAQSRLPDEFLPIHLAALIGNKDIFDLYACDRRDHKYQQVRLQLCGNEGIYTPGQILLLSSHLSKSTYRCSRRK